MAGDSALTRFANSEIHQNVAERSLTVSLRHVVGRRIAVVSTGKVDADGLRSLVHRARRDRPELRGARGLGRAAGAGRRGGAVVGGSVRGVVAGHRRRDARVPRRGRARRHRRRGRGGRHGLRLVLDRRGGRRRRELGGRPRRRAPHVVAAADGPHVARRRHRLRRGREHGRDDDRRGGDRARGGHEGARQRRPVDGRGGRLPGRARGVRGRRHHRHARLPRLLGAGGPGGALVRRAGPADRVRPRHDRRRRRRTRPGCRWRSTTRACPSSACPASRRGVCRDVVYDSQTAARAGRASTGHGLPAPNPYGPFPLNAVMAAGHDAARRAHRRPRSRPAGHPLPLHERRPPEARDHHRA